MTDDHNVFFLITSGPKGSAFFPFPLIIGRNEKLVLASYLTRLETFLVVPENNFIFHQLKILLDPTLNV